MKHFITIILFLAFAFVLFCTSAYYATAQVGTSVTVLCTNENYDNSPYCKASPAYFIVNEEGEAHGVLTSGAEFSQTNVANEVTRLQRFQVENAFWYVSDQGVIHAQSDLQALSIYLYGVLR